MKNSFLDLEDIEVGGQRVIVRVDLNVPIRNGLVTDRTRIKRILPTIQNLQSRGAKVILLSHFGRPNGENVQKYSLSQVVPDLEKELHSSVRFFPECVGEKVEKFIHTMKRGEIILLENTRFHTGEETNDSSFSKKLAYLGDIYIGDAFSSSHRVHASTVGMVKFLKKKAIGYSMKAELDALAKVLNSPKHPVMAIVGGAKVSSKISVLKHLIEKVDKLVIGGGMANTFLLAQGMNIGASLCEHEKISMAKEIMRKADKVNCKILLPRDFVIASEVTADVFNQESCGPVPKGQKILDIGSQTIQELKKEIEECRTLVWNGPLGVFETPPFDHGTNVIAKFVAKQVEKAHLIAIGGGGDTLAALAHAGIGEKFTYLSIAGGAFLEWLEGKELPGVSVLIQ